MPDSSLAEWATLVVQEDTAIAKCNLERVLTSNLWKLDDIVQVLQQI